MKKFYRIFLASVLALSLLTGSIGIFGIKDMNRFYRHVLIEKNYPHHAAVMFDHCGKYLWEVFKYLGVPVQDIDYNKCRGNYYPTENPFAE